MLLLELVSWRPSGWAWGREIVTLLEWARSPRQDLRGCQHPATRLNQACGQLEKLLPQCLLHIALTQWMSFKFE